MLTSVALLQTEFDRMQPKNNVYLKQKRGVFMDLGNRLYEFRKQKISQEEAAEKLNVTRQTISKWETNQSQPDFDKIIPICELYGITTDVLFGREERKQEPITNLSNSELDLKKKTGLIISISVFLYFIAVIWIIISTSILWLNENIAVGVFLFICAIATVILVYHFVSLPKKEETKEKQRQKELEKYDGIVALLFTCIYLFISFISRAWHITWIVWIIYALIIEIIHLLLGMKGKGNE